MTTLLLKLVAVTAVVDGLLAGAGLDYTIKQLPARKRIGIAAYREYFLASDLGNGRFWYIPLGLSAYLLNVVVAVLVYAQYPSGSTTLYFDLAAACALVHAFGTSQAVPAGLRFMRLRETDEDKLNESFDRFARWVIFRGILGVPMFIFIIVGFGVIS